MSWIKRNLYFVIGSAVAVALMGVAGWYLFSQWQRNNAFLEELDKVYARLGELNRQTPHPGSSKVDNIDAAKKQRQELLAFIQKSQAAFQRIPPIPDTAKPTDRDFSVALSRTIDQMQRDAANASVSLQPRYSFSFQAQKQAVNFTPGSLIPLSVQLGEVKVISDVLFQANINWLDGIRRERVSTDDASGPQTDYLTQPSVTNELAILSPYELTFRCFSSELAAVLAGFASSPYGLLVKSVNVEPAPAVETPATPTPAPVTSYYVPPQVTAVRSTPTPVPRAAEGDAYMRRYGIPGAPRPTPTPAPTPAPMYYAPAPTAPISRALPTVLDEKLLKVTLTLDVVKLLPAK